jgi:2-dehydropantoate 2-reductase
MRICVFGAGAVGGHLAAKLAAAGHDVSAVARGAQLQAIRQNGFKLVHGEQEIRGKVRASDRAADLGPQDFVIVTLKAPALSGAAGEIARLLGPETAVVFAQNGVPWWYGAGLEAGDHAGRPKPPELARLDPGARLKEAIAPGRVIGAVIYSANDLVEPGVVKNHTPGNNMLVVGECDDRASERIARLRAALQASDMFSPPTADIRQSVWNKLLLNLGTSTLCLLAGRSVGEMRADPQLAAIEKRVREEGRAVARAHGIDPEGAPARPSGSHASGTIRHKPSILQDYEAGRPMEVEAQLAAPLVFARASGVATPTLDVLVPLAVHKAAAKGLYTT